MTETVNPHKIYMWVTAATVIMRGTTSKKINTFKDKNYNSLKNEDDLKVEDSLEKEDNS